MRLYLQLLQQLTNYRMGTSLNPQGVVLWDVCCRPPRGQDLPTGPPDALPAYRLGYMAFSGPSGC